MKKYKQSLLRVYNQARKGDITVARAEDGTRRAFWAEVEAGNRRQALYVLKEAKQTIERIYMGASLDACDRLQEYILYLRNYHATLEEIDDFLLEPKPETV